MRFKNDIYLRRLVRAMAEPKDPEDVSKELCAYMIEAGLFEDDSENWGVSVLIATGPQYVAEVCKTLSDYLGVSPIPADAWDAFTRLTILGDGKCPYCGGELLFDEIEGHELNDGDYFTPNSYVVDNYCYHCVECGEVYKTPNELC